MNYEQLKTFCDPSREIIAVPFSLGDHSYATNGHIMLRLPRRADVPEVPEAINEKAAALFDNLDMAASESALVEIPELPEAISAPCNRCRGSGRVSTCKECDGEGEVDLANDYNTYYGITCGTCHGDGFMAGASDNESPCASCKGAGKKPLIQRIVIGPSGYSNHYLSLLKDLQGCRIAPLNNHSGAYFRWLHGDGILMPMSVL